MRSRTVREGSVGLIIMLGLGCIIGITAWLRGARIGGSYGLAIELPDAIGLSVGSAVKYRGVKVGRVDSLTPSLNGVVAKVSISPPSTVIPRNSTVAVTQSGFIGQVELSIQPGSTAPAPVAANLSPYRPDCNAAVTLCDGDRLSGSVGANFDSLIRSTTKLANLLTEKELLDNANVALKTFAVTAKNLTAVSRNANKTLRDVSQSASEFNSLSQETRQQLRLLPPVAQSVSQAANGIGTVGRRLDKTAVDLSTAANQVTSLVKVNRGSIDSTLGNLQDTSQELKVAVRGLSPVINRLETSKLIDNLEALADNGAKASANLNSLTASLNNPGTILGLSQTLDSARVTFENTQKITTDLEQVTGSPKFRENLIKLINGLGKLLSSSQTLERQLAAVREPSPADFHIGAESARSASIAIEPSPALSQLSLSLAPAGLTLDSQAPQSAAGSSSQVPIQSLFPQLSGATP